ncbi:chorismate lyase [Pseudomonas sp. MH10]|uniref:chorismate--pyruvate lyase family protein n=1 Tax=Pseudomonas sp. MH10 TaxID=3048627 RepID=UPI002AC902A6|nr:chorismate lyase [Pseudomonas sp. MH10]MEB0041747.1 chorismate lyase [Pseudomonas sp. MH10]WPX62704.1 chorismate lyase [Pseudomonas sp. MH10]
MPQQNPLLVASDWRQQHQLMELPEPIVLDWLFNQDSLTRRLTRLSADGFSILPLFEGWQALRAEECAALSLPDQSIGWVREVYLRGNGQKWVFARSVAAQSALQQGGLNMDKLGTRSLGGLLFCDEAFERGALEACRYPAAWLPNEDTADGLWGRRSCFSRGVLSLLVAEIFLPDFWHAVGIAGADDTERH